MASYQWTDRATGAIVNLNEVDKAIVDYINSRNPAAPETVSETHFHPLYNLALNIGFGYLMREGGSRVPQYPEFHRVFEKTWSEMGDAIQADLLWIFYKWELCAWR